MERAGEDVRHLTELGVVVAAIRPQILGRHLQIGVSPPLELRQQLDDRLGLLILFHVEEELIDHGGFNSLCERGACLHSRREAKPRTIGFSAAAGAR